MVTNRLRGMYNQKREDYERPSDDFFQTPPEATRALLANIDIPRGVTLWESSCGLGAISKVLEANLPNKVLSTELNKDRYGIGGVDFFKADDYVPKEPFWIITNPSYRIADNYIRQAFKYGAETVIMLLRTAYLESAKVREDILNNGHLLRVFLIKERLKMYPEEYTGDKNQTSKYTHSWFIWNKRYINPNPTEIVVHRISLKDGQHLK